VTSAHVREVVIQKVVDKLGGVYSAAEALGVGPEIVRLYLAGRWPVPDTVLLRGVDIVLDQHLDASFVRSASSRS
jgi:hypothetical protein